MRPRNEILQERAETVRAAHAQWHRHDGTANEHSTEELAEFDRLQARVAALDEELRRLDQHEARRAMVDGQHAGLAGTQGRTSPADMPHTDPANTRNGRHEFSLLKFFRQIDPSNKGDALDGLELETSQELAVRAARDGRAPSGHLLPFDLPINLAHAARGAALLNTRGLLGAEHRATLSTSTGSGSVPTIVDTSLIEVLRNRVLLARLGATILTGLTGNLYLPKQTAAATASWLAEGATNNTGSSQAIGQVALSPKRINAFQEYSKLLLKQSSIDVEHFVRKDTAAVLAVAFDAAGFNGPGTSNQPLGIIPHPDVNVVSLGTNGADPTWAKVVELETAMEDDNALDGEIAFVTSPKGRGKLKTTTKVASSTFGDFLWDRENRVNSYPAYTTKNVPSNLSKGSGSNLSAAVLGNFASVVMGMWGEGADVTIDPYTLATSGLVRVTMENYGDVALRYAESFSVIKDMIAA